MIAQIRPLIILALIFFAWGFIIPIILILSDSLKRRREKDGRGKI